MRLLLIRHGQTPNNVDGVLDTGEPGAALTTLGEAQAAAIPSALADESIAGIHVSRLLRTHLTAAPLAEATGLTPQVHPGLQEILAGDYDLRDDEEAAFGYREAGRRWVRGDTGHAVPGGEDGHAFLRRYDDAIAEVVASHAPDATAAIVSHGAAIRVWATLATGLDPEELDGRRLGNTGMVVVEGDPEGGWTLIDWRIEPIGGTVLTGDASHDVTANPSATAGEHDHPHAAANAR